MRIDLGAILPEAPEPGQSAKPNVRPALNGVHAGGDTAKLSQSQGRIDELTSQVKQLPDIRQEKVAALKLAIEQGSYQVTPGQAAEALISAMQIRSAA
jgi:flagellar biosynthesis anti-sigma factor FlgM